jgi:hypothetical protein
MKDDHFSVCSVEVQQNFWCVLYLIISVLCTLSASDLLPRTWMTGHCCGELTRVQRIKRVLAASPALYNLPNPLNDMNAFWEERRDDSDTACG